MRELTKRARRSPSFYLVRIDVGDGPAQRMCGFDDGAHGFWEFGQAPTDHVKLLLLGNKGTVQCVEVS